MRLKPLKFVSISLTFLFLFSCLTINIYFPEAEVRKDAEQIVKEIVKSEEEKKEEKDKKKNFTEVGERQQAISARGNSFSLIPAAYAQEEVTNPKIRALKQSLGERFQKLKPSFDKGNIGLTNDGFIQIRDESGLNLKEKAMLRNLVKDDNNNRRNFYAEYAKAKEIEASQIKRVQKIFAERWIKEAKTGWWIQKEDGGWVKKT